MLQRVTKTIVPGLILSLLACTNPFTTREGQVETPENISPGGSSTYDPAVNPEVVFVNLKKAIAEKNVDEYMRCFVQATQPVPPHRFQFIPEQHFINEFEKQPWTLSDEQNYFIQLSRSQKGIYPKMQLQLAAGGEISLNPITPTSVNDSLETNSVPYTLTITYSSDSTAVYSGNLQFRLFRSKTPPEIWYIYYWLDNAVNKNYDQTWTALKLYYRKKAL